MKPMLLPARLALALAFIAPLRAADSAAAVPTPPAASVSPATPAPASAELELKNLITQIRQKLKSLDHRPTATDLAPELAAFEALQSKYAGQKTEEVGEIAISRAMLYGQVLDDNKKAKEILTQAQTTYAGTRAADVAGRYLEAITQEETAEATKAALIGKPAPEIHFRWSTNDQLKTLSNLKGKVVLIDFWATWCGPCIASFPHMRELVEHYKGSDVVAVGVTSIQGRVANLASGPVDTKGDPAKEISLLPEFIKQKNMTWTVAVSDENVFNSDYGVTGIPCVAVVAPDGTIRKIVHPAELTTDAIDAVLKEFNRPLPATGKS